MARLYRATPSEFDFLLNFVEMPPPPWREGAREARTEEELSACAAALLEKRWLLRDEGGCVLDDGLLFLLSAAKKASRIFVLEGAGHGKEAVYFEGDTIVLLQEEEDSAALMWIPVLPLLMGQLANALSPFLNEKSGPQASYPAGEYASLLTRYEDAGYAAQWRFYTRGGPGPSMEQPGLIFTDRREQVMLLPGPDSLTLLRPGKADCINTLTRIIAPLHGGAMAEGGR